MRCHECTGKFGMIRHHLLTLSGSVYFCRQRCLRDYQARVLEAIRKKKLSPGSPDQTRSSTILGYWSPSP
jgi:hypothetical protein